MLLMTVCVHNESDNERSAVVVKCVRGRCKWPLCVLPGENLWVATLCLLTVNKMFTTILLCKRFLRYLLAQNNWSL